MSIKNLYTSSVKEYQHIIVNEISTDRLDLNNTHYGINLATHNSVNVKTHSGVIVCTNSAAIPSNGSQVVTVHLEGFDENRSNVFLTINGADSSLNDVLTIGVRKFDTESFQVFISNMSNSEYAAGTTFFISYLVLL